MKRPWENQITRDLIEKEGHYVDFAAFLLWVGDDLESVDLSYCDMTYVYSLACRVVDEIEDPSQRSEEEQDMIDIVEAAWVEAMKIETAYRRCRNGKMSLDDLGNQVAESLDAINRVRTALVQYRVSP